MQRREYSIRIRTYSHILVLVIVDSEKTSNTLCTLARVHSLTKYNTPDKI
jgi:hypothetical protein